ncbi:hypothetical protein [Anoxybacillus kestanbolensis]|uniref:hypothetical protein n=1 Tax=Anoxybacillus kestanbolensis TaxID=227476 RepID=UPI003D21A29E
MNNVIIPTNILTLLEQKRLTPNAFTLLVVLLNEKQTQRDTVRCTLKQLCAKTGLRKLDVHNARKRLKALGLITVDNGVYTVNERAVIQ